MPTLNYTTSIDASRTISEIQAMLVDHGAESVATSYTNKAPTGISFWLVTPHGRRAFTLKVDVEAVQRLLVHQHKTGEIRLTGGKRDRYQTAEHAARVAWRVLKDYVEANLAMVEAQMATIDQVMLPYLHVDGELTVYDKYLESEQAMLALNPAQ